MLLLRNYDHRLVKSQFISTFSGDWSFSLCDGDADSFIDKNRNLYPNVQDYQ